MTRDDIKDTLREILAEQTHGSEAATAGVAETTALAELGLDSLAMLEVVYDVEEKFHVEVQDSELVDTKTIGHLLDLIEKKTAARRPS
jgi:acyl carrier protein